jgi:hypothetical protein
MDHIQRLVNAYENLKHRVDETLRIQHGDVGRLRAQQDEVCAFAADATRVSRLSILIDSQYSSLSGSELVECRGQSYMARLDCQDARSFRCFGGHGAG